MSDVDMYQYIERGMRGGVSYIAHRHAKANNKYMKNYDPTKADKHIMYLDANNLYGWAMSQSLPTGNFKWENVNKINLEKYGENSERGLILEVDLKYPTKLHDTHNGYPLAPERRLIQDSELSEYCTKIKNEFDLPSDNAGKLVTTLCDKKNYVVHARNLKLYTNLGLKVTKVHKALSFDQSPWLDKYIAFNTKMRSAAKNDFEKNFFKLMNNSVFGKTMEKKNRHTYG